MREARIEIYFRDVLGLSNELRSAIAAAAEDTALSKEDIRVLASIAHGYTAAVDGTSALYYVWDIPFDEREHHISLLYRYFKMGLLTIWPELGDSNSQKPANALEVYIYFDKEALAQDIPEFNTESDWLSRGGGFSLLEGLSEEWERLLEEA